MHLIDRVACPLLVHLVGNSCHDFVVGRSAPQQRSQICMPECKEAVAKLAVGGEADPIACLAERLGHAGDDAELAVSVRKGESLGGRGASGDRCEIEFRSGRCQDLFGRDDPFV